MRRARAALGGRRGRGSADQGGRLGLRGVLRRSAGRVSFSVRRRLPHRRLRLCLRSMRRRRRFCGLRRLWRMHEVRGARGAGRAEAGGDDAGVRRPARLRRRNRSRGQARRRREARPRPGRHVRAPGLCGLSGLRRPRRGSQWPGLSYRSFTTRGRRRPARVGAARAPRLTGGRRRSVLLAPRRVRAALNGGISGRVHAQRP
mmetsp:Transcript_29633/g.99756  ORF Transcript_29633/g.99756 Transcript_29633/m.99756 type:complete len:202 (-) Transcript_29633:868-1473(-)